MSDLVVPGGPTIPGADLTVETMRAGGPGGQHVNTTDSAVRLRLDLAGTRALHAGIKRRLHAAVPGQITDAGELLIVSTRYRSQHRNLADARTRLADLIVTHLRPPKPRRPTKPTKGSKTRRLTKKKARGDTKRLRKAPRHDD